MRGEYVGVNRHVAYYRRRSVRVIEVGFRTRYFKRMFFPSKVSKES